jgi:protein-tyrosine phosphatase
MHLADIHFHLLPGVDDGPAEMEDSVELARAAVAEGTRAVVATPHVRDDFVTDPLELADRVAELRHALADAGVPLDVRCGGELGHEIVPRLDHEELDAVAQGPGGARWLLLESPFEGFTPEFHAAADELRERGFGVVIAHPERTADAATDGVAGVERELRAGSLAQVNALSLLGRHGHEARRAAHILVARGLAALVASDAHGPTRPPSLVPAVDALRWMGAAPQAARALVCRRPLELLASGLPRPALAA